MNCGVRVSAKVSVKLSAANETEEAPALTVHWLLASVPGDPKSAEPTYPSPESCTRTSVFVVRIYCTKQELGAAICVLKRIFTELILVYPDGWEYTKLKI